MIASFFQNLKAHQVEYRLISGQAAVMHGAATFSEDIDLWIQPVQANAESFLRALRAQHARYYKLTPPWELSYLRRGHGFHFVLAQGQPDPENEEAVQQWMQQRTSGLQKADRDYWRPIIEELRSLRSRGKLTKETEPV